MIEPRLGVDEAAGGVADMAGVARLVVAQGVVDDRLAERGEAFPADHDLVDGQAHRAAAQMVGAVTLYGS